MQKAYTLYAKSIQCEKPVIAMLSILNLLKSILRQLKISMSN
jgi:hypothetical protein